MILYFFSHIGVNEGCISDDTYQHLKIELDKYIPRQEYKLSKQDIKEIEKVVVDSMTDQFKKRESSPTGLRRLVEIDFFGKKEILNLKNSYDRVVYSLNGLYNFIQLVIENEWDMSIELSDDLDYLPTGIEKILERRRNS